MDRTKLSAVSAKLVLMLAATAVLGFTVGSAFASSPASNVSYGGNLPPWVDYFEHANNSVSPQVLASDNCSLLDIHAVKNPYNGELPPWVDYNTQVNPYYSQGPVVLTVNGNVNNPSGFRISDLDALGTSPFKGSFDMKGCLCCDGKINVSGRSFSLNALLDKVQPTSSATTVTFIGSDGFKKSVTIAEIRAHPDYVIVIEDAGWLHDILPNKSTMYWVKWVTTIQIQ